MISVQQWAINAAVKGMIKDAEADGRILEAVNIVSSAIKGFFPGDEKVIKQMLVQFVVLPFCRLLLKDDLEGLKRAKESF